MRQIKEENIKLKESLRYKGRELEQKNAEYDAVCIQLEELLYIYILLGDGSLNCDHLI